MFKATEKRTKVAAKALANDGKTQSDELGYTLIGLCPKSLFIRFVLR